MTTSTFAISGMTCEHCERAVEREVGGLPGVTAANASASDGTVVIESDQPPAEGALRAAVEEAGYELRET